MNIHSALKNQYHAALKTLRIAIEKCPAEMWNGPGDSPPVWRVVSHTLFFTHFYSQQSQEAFVPWPRWREEANVMTHVPWENNRPPKPCEPFTRDDLLEYWKFCDDRVDEWVDKLDLSAEQCGFPWYKMPTLEHQLVNLRHIQHHAAMLAAKLRARAGINVEWVGRA